MLTTTLRKDELDHKKSRHRCSDNFRVKIFFTLPSSSAPKMEEEEEETGSGVAGVIGFDNELDDGGDVLLPHAGPVVVDGQASVVASETLLRRRGGGGGGESMIEQLGSSYPPPHHHHHHHRRSYLVSSSRGLDVEAANTFGLHSETSSFHSESEANLTEDEPDSDANAMESEGRLKPKNAGWCDRVSAWWLGLLSLTA